MALPQATLATRSQFAVHFNLCFVSAGIYTAKSSPQRQACLARGSCLHGCAQLQLQACQHKACAALLHTDRLSWLVAHGLSQLETAGKHGLHRNAPAAPHRSVAKLLGSFMSIHSPAHDRRWVSSLRDGIQKHASVFIAQNTASTISRKLVTCSTDTLI